MKITNYTDSSKIFNKNTRTTAAQKNQNLQKPETIELLQSVPDRELLVNKKEFMQYKKAQEYVEKVIKRTAAEPNIHDFDIDKLEGLQYGIKVFEGLSMRQIALLYNHNLAICTSRGCSNGCVHCFVDAKPVHLPKDDHTTIKQMSWEDFSDFTTGIKELNRRIYCKNNTGLNSSVAPFWDADCMEIVMKDKNGKEYDIIDISERIIKDMNKSVLFDTSGWTPKNKKQQERAEKYVNYLKNRALKSTTKSEFAADINISLNPFHKLHSKYVEYLNSDPERAKKFRELYTERMANTFYTFTPVLKYAAVIDRVMADYTRCSEIYKQEAQEQLIAEIRTKLKEKYKNDSSLTEDDIKKALSRFDYITSFIVQDVLPSGRGENLYKPYDYKLGLAKFMHEKNHEHPEKILTNTKGVSGSLLLIDANGRVYATNHFDTVPTDIQLNFKNKHKKTPPFNSLIDRVVMTDELYGASDYDKNY